MIKIAVFISGSGSNCEQLIRHFNNAPEGQAKGAEIALVVSNRADAYGLVRAERLGVPTVVVPKAELAKSEVVLPLLQRWRNIG